MKRGIAPLMGFVLLYGIAWGQEPTNPNADQLKCFAPFIGTWRFEGPSLEDVPGVAEKGTECLIEFSWKRILNKGAVESSLYVEMDNRNVIVSSKSLNAWNASDQSIVLAGASSHGAIFLGNVVPASDKKQLTVSWRGSSADGSPTSSRAVFTITDPDTLTFEALEREDLIIQGPSPVYTLKRVQPRKRDQSPPVPGTSSPGTGD
jgi:hypothetical protein